jgi:H+/Cl- antiporter ClcA
VHVAVAVSDSLMRLHCFRHCRRNISKRLEILGCASAAGVASTFGTPFGGVLFSIEVRHPNPKPHHPPK